MKITAHILILVLSLSLVMTGMAQQKNPVRLELNAKMTEDSYQLIPCGEEGVVIFYEEDEVQDNGKKYWHFALFDTSLQESWMMVAELQKGMSFYEEALIGNMLYLFFADVEGRKANEADYQILKVRLSDGDTSVFSGNYQEKSEPSAFKVIGENVWIGLAHRKASTLLVVLNPRTGESKQVEIDIPNQNIISGIFPDSLHQQVHLVIQNFTSKLQSGLYYQTYTMEGELISSAEIRPGLSEHYLNEAEIMFRNHDKFFLGTYNTDRGKVPFEGEEGLPFAAGFYIAKVSGNEQEFINFYNFLEFENLFNSLSGRDIMRVRKKAEKQKSPEQEYSLNYNLLLHSVIDYRGSFIMLAEAFYPEYRTVTNMYYDYYGRLMPQTYTVFDGYKYFNGIIAAFDREGKLLWDNDIEIWNVLTFNLDKYLNFFVNDSELALFYTWEGKINYKIIDIATQLADADQVILDLKYRKDKVLLETGSRIIHWYDRYFIACGYQEIKNNSLVNNKRTVFYINKVAFQ
jgi:hypothetical protein